MSKYLLLFAIVVAVVQIGAASEEFKKKLHDISGKCITEAHASPDVAKLIGSANLPQTTTEMCFLECFYKSLALLKDGVFNVDAAKQLAQTKFAGNAEALSKADNAIKSCSAEAINNSNEVCAMGKILRSCFIKHRDELNFTD